MESKNIIISPVGVEEPKVHILSINGDLFNVAIELQLITLIGASVNSVNSEFRQFNVDTLKLNKVIKYQSEKKQFNDTFRKVKEAIVSQMQKDELNVNNINIKNIAYHGLDYAIIYYLLIRSYNYNEQYFVNLNSFITISPIFDVFDKIMKTQKVKWNVSDLAQLSDHILLFRDSNINIGSKIMCLSRNQIENSADLSNTIWKVFYINRILKNIVDQKFKLFSPMIDWGLIKCVAKYIFTISALINKVSFGDNINYIRMTSEKQTKLASELISGNLHYHIIEEIRQLTIKLQEQTQNVDYALGDLVVVAFYEHMGNTFFNEINQFIENYKTTKKLNTESPIRNIFQNHINFKNTVFQYVYTTYVLAQNGIIHNDPHLNNILITKVPTRGRQDFQLLSGKIISIDDIDSNLTLIDFDKSILSHYHHNHFDVIAQSINEEMAIVFESGEGLKNTIVGDYNQIFNCFVMYDIVRFGLIMRQILSDIDQSIELIPKNVLQNNLVFIDKMIKLASDILYKIYQNNAKFPFSITDLHGSTEWLITSLFGEYLKVSKTKSSLAKSFQLVKMHSTPNKDRPEFISSRRKYVDSMKYQYISKYISNNS